MGYTTENKTPSAKEVATLTIASPIVTPSTVKAIEKVEILNQLTPVIYFQIED